MDQKELTDDFKLKKPLLSLWFIQKYFSVTRDKHVKRFKPEFTNVIFIHYYTERYVYDFSGAL